MFYDFEDWRCPECDGRYCSVPCPRTETSVWVVGHGWTDPETAKAFEAMGRTVQW
jgi:hypothetical protein